MAPFFCRFCGKPILPDSQFCAHCGKRLAGGSIGRERLIHRLRLRTPYPYALMAFLLFVAWALQPGPPPFDYATVSLDLELQGETSVPADNLFRHHFSLVVENVGRAPLSEVPVRIRARFDPGQPGQVECDVLGRQLVILTDGEEVPLVIVLTDDIGPEEKRRYNIDGIATSAPPFRIVYEVLAEDSDQVLTSFRGVVGAREDPADVPAASIRRERAVRESDS